MKKMISKELITATAKFAASVRTLCFSAPTSYVYHPLDYAKNAHNLYLERWAQNRKKSLFLGMNPGPWGMAQTGVPFGEISAVRDWLGISVAVGRPESEHPQRPVLGFDCARSEVSGRRLWGLFKEEFGQPEKFFENHFVLNYCPLVFMEESGRNRTPDKLPVREREPLEKMCDDFLREAVQILEPDHLIGVGGFAESCFKKVFPERKVDRILHPSPASPAANRDWAGSARKALVDVGIW